MPLVRIAVPCRLGLDDIRHISAVVHRALVDVFNAPRDDRFQVITRHAPDELVYAPEYLGIRHQRAVVVIQITCNEGRTVETKRALYARLARDIAAGSDVPASDVIINLVEVPKENWSFGDGLAQYAD